MTPWLIALVLSTAILHASWNAILRRGADPIWTGMAIAATAGAISICFLPFLPIPARASWPFIFASFVIHIAYRWFLANAYRWGELGAVYPIARGMAPLLVTLGAVIFAGELLPPLALAGILLVSAGVFTLARKQAHAPVDPKALSLALATGCFIAGYTVIDGMGARLSGNAFAYVFWLDALGGFPLAAIVLATRGTLRNPVAGELSRALLAGILSITAYVLVVWALSLGAMGAVSALRETSTVFAALIGWLFLGERPSWRRLAAAAIIGCGIAAIGLAR